MTEKELQNIEERVGFSVPAYYRETMINYPFSTDSFTEQFMLPNDPREVFGLEGIVLSSAEIEKGLCIGSDGGEGLYFIDAAKEDPVVYVYERETCEHRRFMPTWTAYIEYLAREEAEIAAYEEAQRQRKLTKKWWQFWI